MNYVDEAARMIKAHEGFSGTPYFDTLGNITIGYGRALDLNPLTKDEANYLLRSELNHCVADLAGLQWYSKLTSGRKAALVDMRYNLGQRGFLNFKNMIAAIKSGDYETAADEMLNSRWARQVKTRAVRLAAIMRSGHTGSH